VQTSSEAGNPRTGEATRAEATVELPANVDLHARPAADFVRTAMGFSSTLTVASGDREADAKSLLAILALGAKRGTTLRLTADGDDADVALDALARCVAGLTE
jgi:phosphotransferase system HPr (HPr) family protein